MASDHHPPAAPGTELVSPDEATRAIEALMALHPKGFDLSLGRIRRLLGALGDPHTALPPAIHIAGTNGKGSTALMVESLLRAAGLRVGRYASPHLVDVNERNSKTCCKSFGKAYSYEQTTHKSRTKGYCDSRKF